MPQTTVSAAPAIALPGMLVDATINDVRSGLVDQAAGIAPGLLLLRSTGGDRCARTSPELAVGADADAIMTGLATAASQQVIDLSLVGTAGVVGLGRISPPRKLTVTRSNHADHDAVTAVLVGLDENGIPVSENLAFANGGNETVTSTLYYSYFQTLTIPAQAGTGGSTQIGVSTSLTLDGFDVLGVSVHTHKGLVDPSSDNNEVYEDEDVMPYIRRGYLWVRSETVFRAGQCPMVRLVAAGSEVYGAFGAEATDSGDRFSWRKARFMTSGAAAALGVLEVNL